MFLNTLSGRILGLVILFVVIAEVLIFVPAVARFRENYLQHRLDLGQLAALALLATPADQDVSPNLQLELLATADLLTVTLQRAQVRELAMSVENPPMVEANYDLRNPGMIQLIRGAGRVFLSSDNRVISVKGYTQQGLRGEVQVTMYEAPLREQMVAYGLRILYLSLVTSAGVAALLFYAVQWLIVRPIKRVADSMIAYRDAPEDATRVIAPISRARELRQAETALRDLQVQLTAALRQKERLAALGGAVAKISHDLRNLLTTAQLLADRIEASADPAVRRTAPKLVHSLSRAIALCERTLTFGKAEEPPPTLAVVPLAPLVREVVEGESEGVGEKGIAISLDIPATLRVRADADQLFRVLSNLVRNAAQAIEASAKPGTVTVSARAAGRQCEISVADTGPGLPAKARENLFQPFRGGARQGGSGLGLVIAAELVKGHGGALSLVETGPAGTVFRVTLPMP